MSAEIFNPIQRPGLAYQHAFDWLAVQLRATAAPVAALVSSPFGGAELLRRLPQLPFLEPLPQGLVQAGLRLGISPVQVVAQAAEVAAVAWIEPRQQDAPLLVAVQQRLQPGGMLYLVAGDRLARFLTERRQNGAMTTYWAAHEALATLGNAGFRLRSSLNIHGPSAVAWHYLGVLMGRLRQQSWRDRCHYAMRRAFITPARPWGLAALTCLALERVQ